jgi:signal transduction histidine kinase
MKQVKSLPERALVHRILVQDVALAFGACGLDLLIFSDLTQAAAGRATGFPTAALVAYAAAGYLALIWRRRAPVAVFVVLWTHALVTTQMPRYAATLGLAVALYTVATRRSARVALLALLASVVPMSLAVANQVDAAGTDQRISTLLGSAMVFSLLMGISCAAGLWVHGSRRQTAELERRREASAREAVDAERARIARELHDIVAHSVTVMVMQAAGAQRIMRKDPARCEQALAQIEDCGTQAMAELTRMLGVLRDSESDHSDLNLTRQPGLNNVDGLVTRIRETGVAVTLESLGEPRRVDPSVGLTAYRVLQEALTNVTKHAGPGANTTVQLSWGDDLVVDVRNDGHGHVASRAKRLSSGHGLLGLRERVAIAGGTLVAEPSADGGFRLTATLPLASIAGRSGDGLQDLRQVTD